MWPFPFPNDIGRFKRFDRHWRHPANWWFAFLSISYILFVTIFVLISWTALFNKENDSLTTVHKVALALYFSNLLFIISVPRLFLFRFRYFEKLLETLHRIDHLLDKMPQPSCHIMMTWWWRSSFWFQLGFPSLK